MSAYVNPSDLSGTARGTTTRATVTDAYRAADKVRWGPVVAGIFITLSLLATLGVIGSAVGLSAYDPGDRESNYGLGAGIWGLLSVLIAFFIGGWAASGLSGLHRSRDGMCQGALVWAVTIPLMIYLIAGVIGHVSRTTATTAAAGANAVSQQVDIGTVQSLPAAGDTAQNLTAQFANPVNQERAAEIGAATSWGTVAILLLSLGAAVAGGYINSRNDDDRTVNTVGHGAT